jgi:2-C-methyl-D-erythritol 4-phosphate cytidylyltransferase
VTAELRRRVGQTFTLAELADEYARAERWSREALSDAGAPAWWPRSLTVVEGAAFHDYARGAVDFEP